MRLTPELRVLFRPQLVYRELLSESKAGGAWTGWRRPLFLLLILGCTVSLITARRLSPRLFVGGAINGSYVPLLQIVGLAAACRSRRKQSWRSIIDLYFLSQGPWYLWIAFFTAVWAFSAPATAYEGLWSLPIRVYLTVLAVMSWTAWLDFWFFREIMERSRVQACRDILVSRAIPLGIGLVWFVWPGAWTTIAPKLGL